MTLSYKDFARAVNIYNAAGGGDVAMMRAFTFLLQLRTTKTRQEKDRARYERRKVEAAR